MKKEDNSKSNNENEYKKSLTMQDIEKGKNEKEIRWLEKRNYNEIDMKFKEGRVSCNLRRRKTKRRRR